MAVPVAHQWSLAAKYVRHVRRPACCENSIRPRRTSIGRQWLLAMGVFAMLTFRYHSVSKQDQLVSNIIVAVIVSYSHDRLALSLQSGENSGIKICFELGILVRGPFIEHVHWGVFQQGQQQCQPFLLPSRQFAAYQ